MKNRTPINLTYPDNIVINISLTNGKIWNVVQVDPTTAIASINDDVFEGFVFGTPSKEII
jgi:hypothetical protein